MELDYRHKDADLKWSLWTEDESIWQERAPLALADLRAFAAGRLAGGLVVKTAPRKEIRFGTVTIRRPHGSKTVNVRVSFREEWDEPGALLDTLDLADADEVDLLNEVPHTWDEDGGSWGDEESGIGVRVEDEKDFTVGPRTFARMMKWIDGVEARLIEENVAAWSRVEEWAKGRK